MAALAPLNLLVVIGAHCSATEVLADKIRSFHDSDPSSSMEFHSLTGGHMGVAEPDPEDIPGSRGHPRRPLGERLREPWQPDPEPDPCLLADDPTSSSSSRCVATDGARRASPPLTSAETPQVEKWSEIEALAVGKLTAETLLDGESLWSDVLQRKSDRKGAAGGQDAGAGQGARANDTKRSPRGKASVAGFSEYLCQRICPNMIMVPKSLLDLDSGKEGGILLKLADEVNPRPRSADPRAFTLVMSHDNVAALVVIVMLSFLGTIYLWKICTRSQCTCRLCRNQYRTHHLLGSGGYGSVYLVDRVSDGTRLVAKKIQVHKITDLDEYTQEAKELITLRHKHIVSYEEDFVHVEYGTFEPKTYFIIIMEYCPEGDLKEKIEVDFSYFTEEWVRTVFAQLLQAVQYLHSKNVIHRDLKTQNVFLACDGRVRLGDFGLCKHTARRDLNTATLTHAGTDCYMAPEMLSSSRYGKPADIWSLGCVLYELCTGQFMWELDGILGVMVIQDAHKVSKLVQANVVPAVGQAMTSLMKRLLSVNPASRPTVTACIRRKLFKRAFPLSKVPFGESLGEDLEDGVDMTPLHEEGEEETALEADMVGSNSASASSKSEDTDSSSSSSSSSSESQHLQFPPTRNADLPRRRLRNKRTRGGRMH